MIRPRLGRLAAVALVLLALTGCSSTVALEPAPAANDPRCADVTAYLPQNVAGQDRRWTDAQATGAWGDPAAVILTCGVTPPGPSTLVCQTVSGVDWLVDDSDAPRYRLTSFGRTPAVEIYLDNDVVSSVDVLDSLSSLVAKLPKDGECTARPGTS
ncbi:DUF3515 family protein [Microbacterium sp. SORGH_AS_0862]|uniref:DUF3515 family protein n=1 Tax=Microbacterium sp. SORGH_AS_0862 TaxID=3041789 RepID=UPI00278FC1CF|nr:DUF3515 family protein [Microbacterium sp. SORGH_AS_0862]MDQ1206736.1 hypothetical protein [Microbacterium sp. SORGH_AS_0862]